MPAVTPPTEYFATPFMKPRRSTCPCTNLSNQRRTSGWKSEAVLRSMRNLRDVVMEKPVGALAQRPLAYHPLTATQALKFRGPARPVKQRACAGRPAHA